MSMPHVLWFKEVRMTDVDTVGGKNASLGEMISQLDGAGVTVPNGFATTAASYQTFLQQNGLADAIYARLADLNVDDVEALQKTGQAIREQVMCAALPEGLETAMRTAYQQLAAEVTGELSVAVRSSATAEDLPDASFAGQQETFLNVCGIDAVLKATKAVFASLFNDRAIAYRVHQGFDHTQVSLSVGVQQMVRSDLGASGVMFTLDTESGFDQVVFINAAYGLGEMVVQGAINPDEFYLYKPGLASGKPAVLRRHLGSKYKKMVYSTATDTKESVVVTEVDEAKRNVFSISDEDAHHLARQALIIEKHYGRPMDIEWGKDGDTGKLYILQARPETVKSRSDKQVIERYQLKAEGELLVTGRSVGQRISSGHARIVNGINEINQVKDGDVLVTDMTDPDWEPVMKRAAAIVTNRGGRTCHAAIIARELGIPAVVGCGDATSKITEGQAVTVSCAQGDTGYIYDQQLEYAVTRIDVDKMPDLPVKIMLNVGNPDRAFAFHSVPNAGVGLARLEFLISNTIGIHPKALLNFEQLAPKLQKKIQQRTQAYGSPVEYYVERLKEGIATIAAAFAPNPVIVRLSDFKSNEYANLLGGSLYEPHEENPMIGFRGASRYFSDDFRDCFALECQAVRRVREEMGLSNVQVMIPFVRTLGEAQSVITTLAENGLERGKNDLKLIMMCEIPSNALLAEQFLEYFDGFSIGSNDLTQLTLGLDRDSALVAQTFDERDPAVRALLHLAIQACKKQGKYIGICGQGPSDHQDFAQWLVQEGIDSISLNPDSVIETCLFLAEQNNAKTAA